MANHLITDLASLEKLYGQKSERSVKKELPALNDAYRAWLEQSSFFALASLGSGGMDCTPRGDAPGQAFRVIDNNTLLIPDRRGNNRLDTLRNIIEDPRIALLFLIPNVYEALRINGTASISADPELLASFAVGNKLPQTCLQVTIESVYFQCARAISRAELWQHSGAARSAEVPTAGQMLKAANVDIDPDSYDEKIRNMVKGELY